ncbi:MAG TPA: heavy metal-binding domain-containing protein [Acidimicrobiales bacterium]|nr:heavy metal-binding domain-containing protein [Acidimicrobiales bacterium]
MSEWDGRGLPPIVEARLERARRSGVRTSLLSVSGQAGLDHSGFAPVGEVMGCVVEHIGFQGYGGCGIYPGYGMAVSGYARTQTSGDGGFAGFAPYVDALNAGWDGAIGRMLTECRELGGDGVVGVRLQERHLGEGNREFVTLGTAVRSLGGRHTDRPFATALDGQDVVKLMGARWVPAAIVVAIAVAIRHDDYNTRLATRAYAGNVEVPGYSELVTFARDDARRVLERRVARIGADGAVLTSPMRLQIHALEVSDGHTDHVAEASMAATAVAYFGNAVATPPSPRMVLPLD